MESATNDLINSQAKLINSWKLMFQLEKKVGVAKKGMEELDSNENEEAISSLVTLSSEHLNTCKELCALEDAVKVAIVWVDHLRAGSESSEDEEESFVVIDESVYKDKLRSFKKEPRGK